MQLWVWDRRGFLTHLVSSFSSGSVFFIAYLTASLVISLAILEGDPTVNYYVIVFCGHEHCCWLMRAFAFCISLAFEYDFYSKSFPDRHIVSDRSSPYLSGPYIAWHDIPENFLRYSYTDPQILWVAYLRQSLSHCRHLLLYSNPVCHPCYLYHHDHPQSQSFVSLNYCKCGFAGREIGFAFFCKGYFLYLAVAFECDNPLLFSQGRMPELTAEYASPHIPTSLMNCIRVISSILFIFQHNKYLPFLINMSSFAVVNNARLARSGYSLGSNEEGALFLCRSLIALAAF